MDTPETISARHRGRHPARGDVREAVRRCRSEALARAAREVRHQVVPQHRLQRWAVRRCSAHLTLTRPLTHCSHHVRSATAAQAARLLCAGRLRLRHHLVTLDSAVGCSFGRSSSEHAGSRRDQQVRAAARLGRPSSEHAGSRRDQDRQVRAAARHRPQGTRRGHHGRRALPSITCLVDRTCNPRLRASWTRTTRGQRPSGAQPTRISRSSMAWRRRPIHAIRASGRM